MKMNKKIIVSTLALAMGAALAGSISGTVAWYQYSTRATTSYIGNSAKCAENLQISLTGDDNDFHSELKTSDFTSGARENKNGSDLKPITFGAEQATGSTAASDPASVTTAPYQHPKYQNFEYTTWGTAAANSYLQYDLYFRVLDVDGASQKNYMAKKIYFEDFTLIFTGATGNTVSDENAFKNALRVQFDQITPSGAKRILLSNTATSEMPLGAKLDLNADGAFDKTGGYEWDGEAAEKEYGDKTIKQSTEAYTTYKGTLSNGSLTAGSKELGTTVSGTYAKASALHFVVTIWLEGWDATGTTAATSIWNAANYIGDFKLGMTFGITDYGQE